MTKAQNRTMTSKTKGSIMAEREEKLAQMKSDLLYLSKEFNHLHSDRADDVVAVLELSFALCQAIMKTSADLLGEDCELVEAAAKMEAADMCEADFILL